jgi:hypothetical protein
VPRRFVFDCPGCDARVVVDAAIRAELLAEGCVLCRTSVSAEDFSRRRGSDVTA